MLISFGLDITPATATFPSSCLLHQGAVKRFLVLGTAVRECNSMSGPDDVLISLTTGYLFSLGTDGQISRRSATNGGHKKRK
jgi:hypothetical protein